MLRALRADRLVRQPVRAGAAAAVPLPARRLQPSTTLSQEELRSLVLEGAQYFRGKHQTMLANLMDLEAISVDDVMTPRSQIHALDLAEKPALLRQQLATSYHTRLPVYEDALDNIIGVLRREEHPARACRAASSTPSACARVLRPPYFVPVGHAAARPSCSSSRPTASGSGSSSTNTASCRAW